MKVFVINMPSPDSVGVYKKGIEVIADYCKRFGLDLFLLEKNDFGVHPSWLKLKCFDYTNDDFVLCWDADLLPKKNIPNIVNSLKLDKINAVIDTCYYIRPSALLFPVATFRYNCGLVGFPRSYRGLMDKVFLEAKTSTLPSYEQYPLNFELAKNQWKDVHELDRSWNCIFHLPNLPTAFVTTAHMIHYTGIDNKTREMLIDGHRSLYFS